MAQSVIDGEVEDAERLAREGLDAGLPAGDILDKGFVKGIEDHPRGEVRQHGVRHDTGGAS